PLSSTPPPTAHIYPLSLHDALPISSDDAMDPVPVALGIVEPLEDQGRSAVDSRHVLDAGSTSLDRPSRIAREVDRAHDGLIELADRKSTRLNSSHRTISYAVFCLKK